MIIFDFFASAFLSVFFSVAPKYWKNCTDEKMKSFVNKLFLTLTIAQVVKLIFCAVVLIAIFLKQHGAGHGAGHGRHQGTEQGTDGRQGGGRPAFSVCRIFYCRQAWRG